MNIIISLIINYTFVIIICQTITITALSRGNHRYAFRNPQYQIPKYEHTYIKLTCRFRLPQLLNSCMKSDLNDGDHENDSYLSIVMKNIENVPLTGFKKIVKSYFLNKYLLHCTIINCYVCQPH